MAVVLTTLGLLALVTRCGATDPTTLSPALYLAAVPDCATPCMLPLLEAAGCSLDATDFADCLCTNITLLSDVSTCAQTSCSLYNASVALVLEDQICDAYPKESRAREGIIAAGISFAVSIPVIIARCAARLKFSKKLWADDYAAIMATVVLVALAAVQIVCVQNGFGYHQWEVVTIENNTFLLLLLFVSQIMYIAVQCLAKLSILLLYLRIFSLGTAQWFRLTVKGLVGLTFVFGLVMLFLIIFQCTPVASAWDLSIPGYTCLNFAPLLFAGSVVSILADLVLMALPIPELRKLQISGRKRIGVVIMFTVASLGVVASIVRLNYLIRLNWSWDLSWDEIDVVVWSQIELLCIVVCGSLPALRPYLTVLLPRITSTWQRSRRSMGPTGGSGNLSGTTDSFYDKKRSSYGLNLHPLSSVSSDGQWTRLPGEPQIAEPQKPAVTVTRSFSRKISSSIDEANLPGYTVH